MMNILGVDTLLYPIIDALQFPLIIDSKTMKVTGKAKIGYDLVGIIMDVKVTYSYVNIMNKRCGVIIHMAGDLYIMVSSYDGAVCMSVINGALLEVPPERRSNQYRSPTMSSVKVWDKVKGGITAIYIQNTKGWKNVTDFDKFRKQFYGSGRVVVAGTKPRMESTV